MNEFSHERRIDPAELVRRFELRNFCVPGTRLDFFWHDPARGELLPPSGRDRRLKSYGPLYPMMLMIELVMRVPDRDTGGSGIFCSYASLSTQEMAFMGDNPGERIALAVRDLIRSALLHEADEALHIDGVRVFDPHAVEESFEMIALLTKAKK